MPPAPAHESPWVIFRLNNQYYGLPVGLAQEMLVVPEVTPVPKSPSYVLGMINLRGQVMSLLDLRTRLGLPSALDEKEKLIQLLADREEDHKRWLAELEASVRERRAFGLTTDPHQCAFGRWYDSFQTDDLRLAGQMIKFDAPHKRIHAVGTEVAGLMAAGDQEEALALIDRIRGTVLSKLVVLFGEARENVRNSHTEIAVVLEEEGRVLAVTVDAVESVETLEPGSIKEGAGTFGGHQFTLIAGIARRQEGGAMVLLLDADQLMQESRRM